MPTYEIPYGTTHLTFTLPDSIEPQIIAPRRADPLADPADAVAAAFEPSRGGVDLARFKGARSAAIAISDKTRPVPHDLLLPPLLRGLEAIGIPPGAIHLLVASGTHTPMPPDEYPVILPESIVSRHPVTSHDSRDQEGLRHLGETSRGTPVWVSRHYLDADLRIVVGALAPHQFAGYSGGVKSASIGLTGFETISHNHAMMREPRARLGVYADNPLRQDIEEIGEMIGIQLALNAILDDDHQIVRVLAGEPRAVMESGIALSREFFEVPVGAPFDLLIVSPGGHPKDINLYQGQKALGHASLIMREGGAAIMAAACPEGTGSPSYEAWMEGVSSHQEILTRFAEEGFRVGPHKAFQIARDASRWRTYLVSEMTSARVERLLLHPAATIDDALAEALPDLPAGGRVGIMPYATATIPVLTA